MNNKQIFGIVLGTIIMLTTIVGALAFSITTYYPLNGSTITGSATEYFNITTDTNSTIARVYVNDVPKSLSCIGTLCEANIDLSALSEGQHNYYYFADDGLTSDYEPSGAPGTQYVLTIDRVPSAPTWGVVSSFNSTTLFLNWNDNPELDIKEYNIYGRLNNSTVSKTENDFSATINISEYYHTGLTVGDTWYYVITAVDDALYESTESGIRSGLVTSPPPQEPLVTVSSGECNQTTKSCNSPILNPTYTLNYSTSATNINLTILSGMTEIQKYYNSKLFNWPFSFGTAGTYLFTFRAMDIFGQTSDDDWTMTVGDFDMNLSITDLNKITSTPFIVKGTALSTGSDWIVLGFNISMYYNGITPLYVRNKMTDLVGPSTIEINESSQPFIFCAEDYDSGSQDWSGAGPRYFTNNNYTSDLAINCTDTSGGASVDYTIYLKIPIPSGTQSGEYSSTISWGMYDSAI